MDFSELLSQLRDLAEKYKKSDNEPELSTVYYCECFIKVLQKVEKLISSYEDNIVFLWLCLSNLAETFKNLAKCFARDELCQHIFLLCVKTVLNVKWQQLPEDHESKQNFSVTVESTHKQLKETGFAKFGILLNLMETHWSHPVLSQIMSGESCDTEEALDYINSEDPVILKLRVDIMIEESCEEFALNLCYGCLKHSELADDLNMRQTQLILLHKLNKFNKLQDVCEQLPCSLGIQIIQRLEQSEANQDLCVRLAQTFLVQDWLRPDHYRCTDDLLKLWIRHQYLVDQDREKFMTSIWAVAKVSIETEQIGSLIDALKKECGDTYFQLYTDLLVYAINLDKGCMEQQMLQGNLDGVRTHQRAIASTCKRLADMYKSSDPKVARISALTAFSLDPSSEILHLVESQYKNCDDNKHGTLKEPLKCCEECKKTGYRSSRCKSWTENPDTKVNIATLYEVERLLNMMRPYYLNPELPWKQLQDVCKKFMGEIQQSPEQSQMETRPPVVANQTSHSQMINVSIGSKMTPVASTKNVPFVWQQSVVKASAAHESGRSVSQKILAKQGYSNTVPKSCPPVKAVSHGDIDSSKTQSSTSVSGAQTKQSIPVSALKNLQLSKHTSSVSRPSKQVSDEAKVQCDGKGSLLPQHVQEAVSLSRSENKQFVSTSMPSKLSKLQTKFPGLSFDELSTTPRHQVTQYLKASDLSSATLDMLKAASVGHYTVDGKKIYTLQTKHPSKMATETVSFVLPDAKSLQAAKLSTQDVLKQKKPRKKHATVVRILTGHKTDEKPEQRQTVSTPVSENCTKFQSVASAGQPNYSCPTMSSAKSFAHGQTITQQSPMSLSSKVQLVAPVSTVNQPAASTTVTVSTAMSKVAMTSSSYSTTPKPVTANKIPLAKIKNFSKQSHNVYSNIANVSQKPASDVATTTALYVNTTGVQCSKSSLSSHVGERQQLYGKSATVSKMTSMSTKTKTLSNQAQSNTTVTSQKSLSQSTKRAIAAKATANKPNAYTKATVSFNTESAGHAQVLPQLGSQLFMSNVNVATSTVNTTQGSTIVLPNFQSLTTSQLAALASLQTNMATVPLIAEPQPHNTIQLSPVPGMQSNIFPDSSVSNVQVSNQIPSSMMASLQLLGSQASESMQQVQPQVAMSTFPEIAVGQPMISSALQQNILVVANSSQSLHIPSSSTSVVQAGSSLMQPNIDLANLAASGVNYPAMPGSNYPFVGQIQNSGGTSRVVIAPAIDTNVHATQLMHNTSVVLSQMPSYVQPAQTVTGFSVGSQITTQAATSVPQSGTNQAAYNSVAWPTIQTQGILSVPAQDSCGGSVMDQLIAQMLADSSVPQDQLSLQQMATGQTAMQQILTTRTPLQQMTTVQAPLQQMTTVQTPAQQMTMIPTSLQQIATVQTPAQQMTMVPTSLQQMATIPTTIQQMATAQPFAQQMTRVQTPLQQMATIQAPVQQIVGDQAALQQIGADNTLANNLLEQSILDVLDKTLTNDELSEVANALQAGQDINVPTHSNMAAEQFHSAVSSPLQQFTPSVAAYKRIASEVDSSSVTALNENFLQSPKNVSQTSLAVSNTVANVLQPVGNISQPLECVSESSKHVLQGINISSSAISHDLPMTSRSDTSNLFDLLSMGTHFTQPGKASNANIAPADGRDGHSMSTADACLKTSRLITLEHETLQGKSSKHFDQVVCPKSCLDPQQSLLRSYLSQTLELKKNQHNEVNGSVSMLLEQTKSVDSVLCEGDNKYLSESNIKECSGELDQSLNSYVNKDVQNKEDSNHKVLLRDQKNISNVLAEMETVIADSSELNLAGGPSRYEHSKKIGEDTRTELNWAVLADRLLSKDQGSVDGLIAEKQTRSDIGDECDAVLSNQHSQLKLGEVNIPPSESLDVDVIALNVLTKQGVTDTLDAAEPTGIKTDNEQSDADMSTPQKNSLFSLSDDIMEPQDSNAKKENKVDTFLTEGNKDIDNGVELDTRSKLSQQVNESVMSCDLDTFQFSVESHDGISQEKMENEMSMEVEAKSIVEADEVALFDRNNISEQDNALRVTEVQSEETMNHILHLSETHPVYHIRTEQIQPSEVPQPELSGFFNRQKSVATATVNSADNENKFESSAIIQSKEYQQVPSHVAPKSDEANHILPDEHLALESSLEKSSNSDSIPEDSTAIRSDDALSGKSFMRKYMLGPSSYRYAKTMKQMSQAGSQRTRLSSLDKNPVTAQVIENTLKALKSSGRTSPYVAKKTQPGYKSSLSPRPRATLTHEKINPIPQLTLPVPSAQQMKGTFLKSEKEKSQMPTNVANAIQKEDEKRVKINQMSQLTQPVLSAQVKGATVLKSKKEKSQIPTNAGNALQKEDEKRVTINQIPQLNQPVLNAQQMKGTTFLKSKKEKSQIPTNVGNALQREDEKRVTMILQSDAAHQCLICHEVFNSVGQLRDHVRYTCRQKPEIKQQVSARDFEFSPIYNCPACAFSSPLKSETERHYKFICKFSSLSDCSGSNILLTFRCEMCNDIFTDRELVLDHMSNSCLKKPVDKKADAMLGKWLTVKCSQFDDKHDIISACESSLFAAKCRGSAEECNVKNGCKSELDAVCLESDGHIPKDEISVAVVVPRKHLTDDVRNKEKTEDEKLNAEEKIDMTLRLNNTDEEKAVAGEMIDDEVVYGVDVDHDKMHQDGKVGVQVIGYVGDNNIDQKPVKTDQKTDIVGVNVDEVTNETQENSDKKIDKTLISSDEKTEKEIKRTKVKKINSHCSIKQVEDFDIQESDSSRNQKDENDDADVENIIEPKSVSLKRSEKFQQNASDRDKMIHSKPILRDKKLLKRNRIWDAEHYELDTKKLKSSRNIETDSTLKSKDNSETKLVSRPDTSDKSMAPIFSSVNVSFNDDDGSVTCDDCDLNFRQRLSLVKHLASKHFKVFIRLPSSSKRKKEFFCLLCYKKFNNGPIYFDHVKDHSEQILAELQKNIEESVTSENESELETVKCDQKETVTVDISTRDSEIQEMSADSTSGEACSKERKLQQIKDKSLHNSSSASPVSSSDSNKKISQSIVEKDDNEISDNHKIIHKRTRSHASEVPCTEVSNTSTSSLLCGSSISNRSRRYLSRERQLNDVQVANGADNDSENRSPSKKYKTEEQKSLDVVRKYGTRSANSLGQIDIKWIADKLTSDVKVNSPVKEFTKIDCKVNAKMNHEENGNENIIPWRVRERKKNVCETKILDMVKREESNLMNSMRLRRRTFGAVGRSVNQFTSSIVCTRSVSSINVLEETKMLDFNEADSSIQNEIQSTNQLSMGKGIDEPVEMEVSNTCELLKPMTEQIDDKVNTNISETKADNNSENNCQNEETSVQIVQDEILENGSVEKQSEKPTPLRKTELGSSDINLNNDGGESQVYDKEQPSSSSDGNNLMDSESSEQKAISTADIVVSSVKDPKQEEPNKISYNTLNENQVKVNDVPKRSEHKTNFLTVIDNQLPLLMTDKSQVQFSDKAIEKSQNNSFLDSFVTYVASSCNADSDGSSVGSKPATPVPDVHSTEGKAPEAVLSREIENRALKELRKRHKNKPFSWEIDDLPMKDSKCRKSKSLCEQHKTLSFTWDLENSHEKRLSETSQKTEMMTKETATSSGYIPSCIRDKSNQTKVADLSFCAQVSSDRKCALQATLFRKTDTNNDWMRAFLSHADKSKKRVYDELSNSTESTSSHQETSKHQLKKVHIVHIDRNPLIKRHEQNSVQVSTGNEWLAAFLKSQEKSTKHPNVSNALLLPEGKCVVLPGASSSPSTNVKMTSMSISSFQSPPAKNSRSGVIDHNDSSKWIKAFLQSQIASGEISKVNKSDSHESLHFETQAMESGNKCSNSEIQPEYEIVKTARTRASKMKNSSRKIECEIVQMSDQYLSSSDVKSENQSHISDIENKSIRDSEESFKTVTLRSRNVVLQNERERSSDGNSESSECQSRSSHRLRSRSQSVTSDWEQSSDHFSDTGDASLKLSLRISHNSKSRNRDSSCDRQSNCSSLVSVNSRNIKCHKDSNVLQQSRHSRSPVTSIECDSEKSNNAYSINKSVHCDYEKTSGRTNDSDTTVASNGGKQGKYERFLRSQDMSPSSTGSENSYRTTGRNPDHVTWTKTSLRSHSLPKSSAVQIRHLYHDGKIWEIQKGSVKSTPVAPSVSLSSEPVTPCQVKLIPLSSIKKPSVDYMGEIKVVSQDGKLLPHVKIIRIDCSGKIADTQNSNTGSLASRGKKGGLVSSGVYKWTANRQLYPYDFNKCALVKNCL